MIHGSLLAGAAQVTPAPSLAGGSRRKLPGTPSRGRDLSRGGRAQVRARSPSSVETADARSKSRAEEDEELRLQNVRLREQLASRLRELTVEQREAFLAKHVALASLLREEVEKAEVKAQQAAEPTRQFEPKQTSASGPVYQAQPKGASGAPKKETILWSSNEEEMPPGMAEALLSEQDDRSGIAGPRDEEAAARAVAEAEAELAEAEEELAEAEAAAEMAAAEEAEEMAVAAVARGEGRGQGPEEEEEEVYEVYEPPSTVGRAAERRGPGPTDVASPLSSSGVLSMPTAPWGGRMGQPEFPIGPGSASWAQQPARVEAASAAAGVDEAAAAARARDAAALEEARRQEEERKAAMKQREEEMKAVARARAAEEVANLRPMDVLGKKNDWRILTVPSQPVAGAKCVVFYNRTRSQALRTRPRIQLQGGFNKWELGSLRVDLTPESGVPRSGEVDWWRAEVEIPEDAFDMSFVMTDCEGVYDNNDGQDFRYTLMAGSTPQAWEERKAAMEAEAEEKRGQQEEEERRLAEERRLKELLEQDQKRGRDKANELRTALANMRKALGKDGDKHGRANDGRTMAWAVVQRGRKVTVFYNGAEGPLRNVKSGLNVQVGINGWQDLKRIELAPSDPPSSSLPKEGEPVTEAGEARSEEIRSNETAAAAKGSALRWMSAEYELPDHALWLDFVFFSGNTWDNNSGKDFRFMLELPSGFKDEDAFFKNLEEIYAERETQARLKKEEEERQKEAERAEARRLAREKAMAVLRRQTRHVLYTSPEVIQAGSTITVRYNPQDTVLRGRDRIFIRGGFNRWSHSKFFGPVEMLPPNKGELHFSATIPVPKDAYKMDFVFSDSASAEGTYDNNNGYDYHLPVEGSSKKEARLHVVHIAVEMAPIAKVGGLGDVVTSLARAVQEQGHMVEVIVPSYRFFDSSPLLKDRKMECRFNWGGTHIVVTSQIVEGLRVFFIHPENGMFETQRVYADYGDDVKFDFFCKAALEFLLQSRRQPDVLHCHDWSSAEVARAYWQDYHNYGLGKPRVVFTIHNLEFGQQRIATAAFHSQKVTTVSPTYASEISGHPAIAPHLGKFMGIRNGIDVDIWDPAADMFLPMKYTVQNSEEGKRAARKALRQRINMTDWQDKPIVGVISRLTAQKGMHLIKHAAFRTVDRGGQFVLLGSAPDPKIQGDFNRWAGQMNSDDCRAIFTYDEPLSHLIYAACDFLVVPSMFEPCGLTQMTAMRYGAVPIVRHTGGLRDTVFDVDNDKARAAWDMEGSSDWQRDKLDETNGFAFEGTDPGALDYAINRAMDAYWNDRPWIRSLQKRVMQQDWSWNRPALDYIELYYNLAKSSG